jgi:hypothetical protein
MTIETFERATRYRELIRNLEGKKSKIMKMRSREADDDFNFCRELVVNCLSDAITNAEHEFKKL